MAETDPLQWLKTYFSQQHSLPEDAEVLNYFEQGWMDSFGVFELIEELEETFQIEFDEEHFQQRRFATIQGLAAIIRELQQK